MKMKKPLTGNERKGPSSLYDLRFQRLNGVTALRHRLSGKDGFGMQSPEGVPLRLPGHWHVALCNGTTREMLDRSMILLQVKCHSFM